jgi:AraC-like DNA-binding protein
VVTSRLFRPDPIERVRVIIDRLAEADGHTTIRDPDLCLYRFPHPTRIEKCATFGVTLGLVVQGSKRVRLEGRTFELDPSKLIVFTREAPYESTTSNQDDDHPYLSVAMMFSPERVARALLSLASAGGETVPEPVPAFSIPIQPSIADAIERLLRTLDDPLDRKLLAPLYLDELLFRLLRSDAAAAVRSGVGPPQDATRILEAMQFIRDRHTEKLTVDSLARHVAMSPSHFAHRFTQVARLSPMRYLREVRLERARDLLGAHGARAGDVATRVGFESAAHFARWFKRRFGTPPSQYRLPT